MTAEFDQIIGGEESSSPVPGRKKRSMSPAGRKAVAVAQRLRWAKINAGKTQSGSVRKRKPMSAAAKAKIAAAARARWVKVREAGKKHL